MCMTDSGLGGCSRDTYPESYITKYTSIRRQYSLRSGTLSCFHETVFSSKPFWQLLTTKGTSFFWSCPLGMEKIWQKLTITLKCFHEILFSSKNLSVSSGKSCSANSQHIM